MYFGSSAEGFQCELGMAAFLFCSNLSVVELNDGFYLKTIGPLCFTKELVKGYNLDPLCAIRFNSNDGILIPKEVEDIGFLAFSMMIENRNVVPAIAPYSEPLIGTYTYMGDGYISYGGLRNLSGGNFSISFEVGSQVTSIGIAAFGGYIDVKMIDLSNCQQLKVIQRLAFAQCLNQGQLILPPNIEELYESFEGSNGQLVGLLPNSLRICDNALGSMQGNIAVSDGSELTYWSDNKTGAIKELDLSGAVNLTYVSTGCNKVSLPAGVFDGNINVGKLKDDVGPTIEDDRILIGNTTTFLNWNMLSKEVVCSDDNPYFNDDGFAVYFEKQGVFQLLQVKQSDDIVLKPGTKVREGILSQTIINLTIGSNCQLDEYSLGQCDSLQRLKILGPIDITMIESALDGISVNPTICVSTDVTDSDILKLEVYGQVEFYIPMTNNTLYVPALMGPDVLHYHYLDNGTISIDEKIKDVIIASSGANVSLDGNTITVSNMLSECFLWYVESNELTDSVFVTLNPSGGSFSEVASPIVVKTNGKISSITKIPYKELNDFSGWSLELGGQALSENDILSDGSEIYAIWTHRGPKIVLNNEAATVYSGDQIFNTSVVSEGSTLTLTAEPKEGYELFNWVVNGTVMGSTCDPLVCSNITGDTTISFTFRYFSPSSGLNGISNRELPTMQDTEDLVIVTELGGVLNVSSAIWEGHASVPLVVDDRIYFRAGSRLYAAESDTGLIVASVASAEAKDYYHQLGYGSGIIIDYKTGKAYDLSLNQVFVLPRTVYGAEYYNGLFYTSGKDVYSFSATDDDPNSASEVKEMHFVGHIDDVFSSYGFSRSVFVDHYMYRVVASGYERGIAGIDLDTGAIQTRYLQSIRSMYLDDGWISYHDGYIYLPGYTTGLFGAIATDGFDTLAYISVDGLNFGDEDHFTFTKTGFVSETLFYDEKAYIYAGGDLYSFDIINGKISKDNPRCLNGLVIGHGSMVMEVGYDEKGGDVIYLYIIPYTSFNIGMTVVEDRNGILTSQVVYGLPQNYNSQAIRADLDGRMIWYNDSGHIYNYTTPEKNVYYFFIEDGEHAQWCEAYGRNAAEALKSLGGDIISLDDYKRVTSVFGKAVDKPTIKVLQQNQPTEVASNLMSYSWVKLNDLYDRSYDTCHYYRIIASGNGNSTFSYLDDDGTVSTYIFQNNIGDGRKVLGKMLVPGNDCAKIRFFDGDAELTELTMVYSKSAGASWDLPSIVRNGTDVVWTMNGEAVTSLIQVTAGGADVSLYGMWPASPADLSKDVTVSVEGNVKTVTVALSEQEGTVYLKSVVRDGSGFTEETYELKGSESWTKTMTVSEGTEGMLLYLVRSSEQSFADSIGCALLTEGAGL